MQGSEGSSKGAGARLPGRLFARQAGARAVVLAFALAGLQATTGCGLRIAATETSPAPGGEVLREPPDGAKFADLWQTGKGIDLVLEVGKPTTVRPFMRFSKVSLLFPDEGGGFSETDFQCAMAGLKIGGSQDIWWEAYITLAGGLASYPEIRLIFPFGGDMPFFEAGSTGIVAGALGINISIGKLKLFGEYEAMAMMDHFRATPDAESFVPGIEPSAPVITKVGGGLRLEW